MSLPLTLWQEIQADRAPALDRGKGNLYPRPARERECLEALFHPGLAESQQSEFQFTRELTDCRGRLRPRRRGPTKAGF